MSNSDISTQIEETRKSFEFDLTVLSKDELYLKYFSRTNGVVTELTRIIPNLSLEEKKIYGTVINQLKKDIEDKISQINVTEKTNLDETIKIDKGLQGFLHPTTETIELINDFFRYYGYSVYDGPEIETEEYNFRKLNLPENHPATDLQDTLYINNELLLRTHTSSIETRLLTDHKPPIRAVIPGKVYRNEVRTPTNSSFFFQYQGVVVDKGISIKNLVETLNEFARYLFGEETITRIRYKYYPEVSPGLGIDLRCQFCSGEGCHVCKYRGFVEIAGSGMVHYNTLKMCNIDPEEYTGFAFGMGLDRLVMQKYKIRDIRKLYGGEIIYQ